MTDLSKFQKLQYAGLRSTPFDLPKNGHPPRRKIPRTTEVKRLYAKSGKLLPLKKWAAEYGDIAGEWAAAK